MKYSKEKEEIGDCASPRDLPGSTGTAATETATAEASETAATAAEAAGA